MKPIKFREYFFILLFVLTSFWVLLGVFLNFQKRAPEDYLNKIVEDVTLEEGTGTFSRLGSGNITCYSLFENWILKMDVSCFSSGQDFKKFIQEHQGLLSIMFSPFSVGSEMQDISPLVLWYQQSDFIQNNRWEKDKSAKIRGIYNDLLHQNRYFSETSGEYSFNIALLIKDFIQWVAKKVDYAYVIPLLGDDNKYHLWIRAYLKIYKTGSEDLHIAPAFVDILEDNISQDIDIKNYTKAFFPIFNGSGEVLIPIGEGDRILVELSDFQNQYTVAINPNYNDGDWWVTISLTLPWVIKNASNWQHSPSWSGIPWIDIPYNEGFEDRDQFQDFIKTGSIVPFTLWVDNQKYINLTLLSLLGTGNVKLDRDFFGYSSIDQVVSTTDYQWRQESFYYNKPFVPSSLKVGELHPISPIIDEKCVTNASGDVLVVSRACFESIDHFKQEIRAWWWQIIGMYNDVRELDEMKQLIFRGEESDSDAILCFDHVGRNFIERTWLDECLKLFPRLWKSEMKPLIQNLYEFQTFNQAIADFLQENRDGDYLLDLALVKKYFEKKYPQVRNRTIIWGVPTRSYGWGTRSYFAYWVVWDVSIENTLWEFNWFFSLPIKYINNKNAFLDPLSKAKNSMNIFYDSTWDIFIPLKKPWLLSYIDWNVYWESPIDIWFHAFVDPFHIGRGDGLNGRSVHFNWDKDSNQPSPKPLSSALFSYSGESFLNLTKLSPSDAPFNYSLLQKYLSKRFDLKIHGMDDGLSYTYVSLWNTEKFTETISSFVANIRSPKNVSTDIQTIILNIILSLIYLGVFLFCKDRIGRGLEAINTFFKLDEKARSYREKLSQKIYLFIVKVKSGYIKREKKNLILRFLSDCFVRFKRTSLWHLICNLWNYKNWRVRLLAGAVFFWNLILSFVSPDFSLFSFSGILFWIFMTIITTLADKLKDIILYILIKIRNQWSFNYSIHPIGYIYAIISVIFNRIFTLVPSMVFAKYLDKNPKDILIKDTVLSNIIFFIFWILIRGFSGLTNNGIVFDFLLGTAFSIFNSIFWDMLPRKGSEGKDIKVYNQWIWWVLFLFSLFIFFHLIFNPDDKIQDAVGLTGKYSSVLSAFMSGSLKMLLVAIMLICIAFWLDRYAKSLKK